MTLPIPLNRHEAAIARFRRDLGRLLVFRLALGWLSAWVFVWGTGVLILRAMRVDGAMLFLGAAGVPAVVAGAAWWVRNHLPAPSTIRALLDHRTGSGGLVMAGEQHDLSAWAARLPEPALPKLGWHNPRAWAVAASAWAFLAAGFLIPPGFADVNDRPPLDISAETNQLRDQIKTLKEEKIIDQPRAETLAEKLDRVRDEASARNPSAALEALDHLHKVTTEAAQQAAEAAAREAGKMAKTQTLADALQRAGNDLTPQQLTEAMTRLAGRVADEAETTDLLDNLDPETLAELSREAKEGTADPRTLEKLKAALSQSREKLSKSVEKLRKARLVDGKALEKCEGGECDGSALAEFLKENGTSKLDEALAGAPGKGGVDRGPGAAELTLGDPSSEEGVKFKEQALSPSEATKLKDSVVTAMSKGKPTTGGESGPRVPGALRGATAGGGSAESQIILPRHRAAVEKYFERAAKATGPK